MQITKSERPHIAFFGCTNSGKSSLVNAVTNQTLSVVSEVKGTTTDAVEKAMEILPLGPVVIIDTAGINDEGGKLGQLRVGATLRIFDKTDIAVLVADSTVGLQKEDEDLIKEFEQRKIPYIVVFNKCDLKTPPPQNLSFNYLPLSAKTGEGVNELREKLGHIINENKKEKYIIRDRLNVGDVVVLVIPIDESAPKGRVILPQQNVLRECLDAHSTAICCQPEELESILQQFTPKYVITDSQAFNKVKDIVPKNIILTSFSILMANYRGKLESLVTGASVLSELKDGDKVLISEGCTHHRQCNDIGTVKFPKWIKEFTKRNIDFEFTQGGEFPQKLSEYKLVIHCGGCMLNEAEIQSRQKRAAEQNIPMVNYGMAIAYMNGILTRAMEIFDE
ncbi:[bacterium]|nr:[FeFe] hydrogenase H-cluster maturation GTPase HydF [bacterium]